MHGRSRRWRRRRRWTRARDHQAAVGIVLRAIRIAVAAFRAATVGRSAGTSLGGVAAGSTKNGKRFVAPQRLIHWAPPGELRGKRRANIVAANVAVVTGRDQATWKIQGLAASLARIVHRVLPGIFGQAIRRAGFGRFGRGLADAVATDIARFAFRSVGILLEIATSRVGQPEFGIVAYRRRALVGKLRAKCVVLAASGLIAVLRTNLALQQARQVPVEDALPLRARLSGAHVALAIVGARIPECGKASRRGEKDDKKANAGQKSSEPARLHRHTPRS